MTLDLEQVAIAIGTLVERHARATRPNLQRSDFDAGRAAGYEQAIALLLSTDTTKIRAALAQGGLR